MPRVETVRRPLCAAAVSVKIREKLLFIIGIGVLAINRGGRQISKQIGIKKRLKYQLFWYLNLLEMT